MNNNSIGSNTQHQPHSEIDNNVLSIKFNTNATKTTPTHQMVAAVDSKEIEPVSKSIVRLLVNGVTNQEG